MARAMWGVDYGLVKLRLEKRCWARGRHHRAEQRIAVRIVGQFPRHAAAGELASILHLDKSTLTGIIRRFEAQGAIKRQGDALDGSARALFTLTGQRAQVRSQDIRQQWKPW